MDPIFLDMSEVLEIHKDQVHRYGGDEGIRDVDLLQSALGMPMATFAGEFLHTDFYEMAAAYLFRLVKNHPFVDGNKRVGTVSTVVFLGFNGYELDISNKALEKLVLEVTTGQMDKAEIAVFLKAHCRPSEEQ
jgi:death on curing protein